MEFVFVKRCVRKSLFVDSEKIFVNSKTQALDLGGIKLGSIKNAVGLEKLVNLLRLEVQGNGLTKIEGLENLKNLRELFLSSNSISKIENLGSLTKLERLFLKNSFNRWLIEKPITVEHKADVKEVESEVIDIQERVERLFDNLFSFFGDKGKKTHGTLIKKLKEEVEYLNKGLNLENDFLNIENIYREIMEKLEKAHLGRYKKPYRNTTFFIKENRFTDKEAIKICAPVIISRIKAKVKKE